MNYSDNSHKFVAVLNRKHETPRLFNAALHLTAGLVGTATDQDRERMRFLDYRDSTGRTRAHVSHYPFIVLEAKNGNQLKTLRAAALEAGLACADFPDTMLGVSAAAQLEATAAGSDDIFEPLACCLFGPAEQVDLLVRKFSLYRGPAPTHPTPTAQA
jgi:hypothetical protein